MKTIIPSVLNKDVTRFDIETELGEYFTLEIKGNMMQCFKMVYNEDLDDWMSGEVSGWNVQEDFENLKFADLAPKPVTYREMEAMFVSCQFFVA
jgi:hypothetical protein